jgi:hypothetical protein
MELGRDTGVGGLWGAVFLPGIAGSTLLLLLSSATVTWGLPFPRDLHGFAVGRDS